MASGSINFSVNANDIVTQACKELGTYNGGSINAAQLSDGLFKLNCLVKQYQAGLLPGLMEFSRKRAYLFPQKAQAVYSLGTDKATNSYIETTLSATSPTSDTTLTVTSITGITANQTIGVLLDTGYVQWTTVSGSPSGSTVTIATGLTSQATSGARVIAYTTTLERPLRILEAAVRNTDNVDVLLAPITLKTYESLANKSAEGTPLRFYQESQIETLDLYFDYAFSDADQVVRLVYLSTIDDFDESTDTLDYPQEYFRFLYYALAIDWAPACRAVVSPELQANFNQSFELVQRLNPEVSDEYFQPNL